jgi:hypothetical protein
MPALPTVNAMYVKKVRDFLRTGANYVAASLTIGSGTAAVYIEALDPGMAGNNLQVVITVPGGTSGLTVTAAGNLITVALAVSSGTPVGASNTSTLIAAAINASATANVLVRAFVPAGAGAGQIGAAAAAVNLSGGRQGSGVAGIDTNPANGISARALCSVLDVLQDALDLPAALTATGGTARSVQDTGAFVANTQVGNRVTFGAATTTVALRGVSAVVTSNTANELFFFSLPATPVAGDTYIITGALVEPIVSKLRDGKGLNDSPTGNRFADSRLAVDALVLLARTLGGTVSDRVLMTGTTLAGSTTTRVVPNMLGTRMRPDMFKGMRLIISGQTRTIVGNDETAVFFDLPLSGAPAAATAFNIYYPMDSMDAAIQGTTFIAGSQALQNKILAELIRVAEAAVVAFTLPT